MISWVGGLGLATHDRVHAVAIQHKRFQGAADFNSTGKASDCLTIQRIPANVNRTQCFVLGDGIRQADGAIGTAGEIGDVVLAQDDDLKTRL